MSAGANPRDLVGAGSRPAGAPTGACAVVVAGGSGTRFGDPRGKQFVELCGRPLMCWSLAALAAAPSVTSLVVVCAPECAALVRDEVLPRAGVDVPVTVVDGGATRQESVRNGLVGVPAGCDVVAVHDAARPLVLASDVERVVARVRADDAPDGALLAAPVVDTLKVVDGETVASTPDRSRYWAAQTPQAFRTDVLLDAHRRALLDGWQGTDDASLVERLGGRVVVVEASGHNAKVTVPEDLVIAEGTLARRLAAGQDGGRPA